MVGLSDIPCLGIVVTKVSEYTVAAIYRGCQYLFCYKALVDDLNSRMGELNSERDRMSWKVEEERGNGKKIIDDVLTWQKEVDEMQESDREFKEKFKNRTSWKCIQHLPIPNPASRFRLGRQALKKAETVTGLTNSGMKLLAREIAHLQPAENVPNTNTGFQNFESRKDSYEKLWKDLVNEDGPLILGIYGMPGVGKTHMMEKIWKEAKEKKIFTKVTRADVGNEKLNVISLQNQIANHLGCHLESKDDQEHRASQLKGRIMNGDKILIIFDDVWREIPLEVIIGTSFDDVSISKHFRILLTSREKNVCLANNCKHPVQITTLKYTEAWDLFCNTVGTGKIHSLPDESLARDICTKCAGLPLVIHAVGKALKFMSHNLWKDALEQLENCDIERVPGMDREVYACLKLSFENLKEDAKPCLLLCSLFPEDASIHTAKLIQLAKSSNLVSGGRSRVLAMVDILKSSSLLLEGENDMIIKLHDIIRDVARSIAVEDPRYAFLFAKCGSRLPDYEYGDRKMLHFIMEKNDFHVRDDLKCPGLQTLWLQSKDLKCPDLGSLWLEDMDAELKKFPQSWFGNNMFGNVRLVVLVNFSWQWQFSLQPLDKVKTLLLISSDISYIGETDVSFFPENLETLCLWERCNLPAPLDLSNLKYLRKLEIHMGEYSLLIRPNTISSLSSLEELHVQARLIFIGNVGSDTYVPLLDEICKLSRLTSLQISLRDFEPSQDTTTISNLHEYDICVGEPSRYRSKKVSPVSLTRSIEFHGGSHLQGFQSLIERAENLLLCRTNVDIGKICNGNSKAFAELRYLQIEDCHTLKHLARIPQNEIQHSVRQQQASFAKLITLDIKNCSAMKYLFSKSVARCLVQLQCLTIFSCDAMEAVVMNEGTSDREDILNFSRLKSLNLFDLPRLKSFYKEKESTLYSSTSTTDNSDIPSVQSQPFFDGMVEFPSLEKLYMEDLEDISDIWGKHFCNVDNVSSSFSELKRLELSSCNKLEIVIPPAVSHRLQNLEHMEISDCTSLISEVGIDGSNTEVRPLVALRNMSLVKLHCLTDTGLNSRDRCGSVTLYPNLENLEIRKCDSLRNVFLPSITRDLLQLRKVHVESCNIMREIVGAGEQEMADDIVFPEVMLLKLIELPNLIEFWCGEANTYKVKFPNLLNLELSIGKINLEAIELGRDDSTCQLKSLDISCVKEIQLPSNWQLHFHNLESLKLSHCWWHELKSLCFPRLKVLQVHESECTTLFSFSAFESLQQLQILEILNCALLEEFVEDVRADEPSDPDKKTITLSQLKSITLKNLPNLKSFIHRADYECHMPSLKKVKVDNCGFSNLFSFSGFDSLQQLQELEISNCDLLEEMVEGVRALKASGFDKKAITLSQLKSVTLEHLPNIKSFIHGADYELHMPSLKKLKVDNCGFSTLFSFSTFGNLQFQELEISNCASLEAIVEDVEAGEASGSDKKTIVLSQLNSVVLKDLPKLNRLFDSRNYECQMPVLKQVEVNNCGLSTLIAFSVFRNIQQLEKLKVANCILLEDIVKDLRGEETSDTNEEIITYMQLGSIELMGLPKLRSFSCTVRYAFSMPNLDKFFLCECPQLQNLTSIITSPELEYDDLDKYLHEEVVRQYRKRGNNARDGAGGNGYSNLELEIESETVDEEPPRGTEAN